MEKELDVILYQKMTNQDASALESLYNRYEKLLFSFIYRMTQDKSVSEDILQEVFIKLWHQKATYTDMRGKFSSWLITVSRYTAIDHLRKNKKHVSVQLDEALDVLNTDSEAQVESCVEWRENREMLQEAIQTLNLEQQKIIHLFYFKGYTQNEIASQLEIPLGTVKGRIRLALKHLKTAFEGMEGITHGS